MKVEIKWDYAVETRWRDENVWSVLAIDKDKRWQGILQGIVCLPGRGCSRPGIVSRALYMSELWLLSCPLILKTNNQVAGKGLNEWTRQWWLVTTGRNWQWNYRSVLRLFWWPYLLSYKEPVTNEWQNGWSIWDEWDEWDEWVGSGTVDLDHERPVNFRVDGDD